MSEYVLSNGVTTVAINLEDGSWRVLGTDGRLASKCFFYEGDTGQLLGSTKGRTISLEMTGDETDVDDPIQYEVETPGKSVSQGQVAVVQRVFIDVNTRGEVLAGAFILDGSGVVPFPYAVTTDDRQVWECNGPVGAQGRIFGVRLTGNLRRRVDLYGIEMLVSFGEQEDTMVQAAYQRSILAGATPAASAKAS